jgi:hypothetical protein
MIFELALPVLVLMAAAVLVTRGIEALMPESVSGLIATAALSALVLWLAAAIGFAALYRAEGAPVSVLLGAYQGGLTHFLVLGAKAGFVWGPIVAITVVTAPRRWRTAVW